jgi:hypothetical protein
MAIEQWRIDFEKICKLSEKEKGWKLHDKMWRLTSGKLYKIQDKAGKTVPFIPTEIQLSMLNQFTGRDIVLKARQIMCTTLVMIMFLDACLFEDNMEARTIADDDGTIEKLFKRVQFAYDNLPKFMRELFPLKASNKYEVKIKNRNSHYQVCLSTHGDTVRMLHFSEASFIPGQHVKKRVGESIETVPQNIGETVIIFESIANGGDGMFADMYRQASKGESEYNGIFFTWYDHYEYIQTVTATDIKMIDETLNEEEKVLMEKHGLGYDRIAWRRTKIRSMLGASYEEKLEVFKVKYPENDKDCFLLTGSQVFSPRLIDIYKNDPDACFLKPIKVYNFDVLDVFVERPGGEVLIYHEPDPSRKYVLGGDVSDGTSKGDRSKAFILEVGTSRVMALYDAMNTPPEVFGSRCATLGVYYNYATEAIENNFRDSCVKELIRRRYPNVYYHGMEEGKPLRSWGWNTNDRSKRLIIDQFKYDFESNEVWHALPEKLLIEMEHYIELDNKRTEASQGYHDDFIMSFAIANYLALKLPSYQKRNDKPTENLEYKKILKDGGMLGYHGSKKGARNFNDGGI